MNKRSTFGLVVVPVLFGGLFFLYRGMVQPEGIETVAGMVTATVRGALGMICVSLLVLFALRYWHQQIIKSMEQEERAAEFLRKKEWEACMLEWEKQRSGQQIAYKKQLQTLETEKTNSLHAWQMEEKEILHALEEKKSGAEFLRKKEWEELLRASASARTQPSSALECTAEAGDDLEKRLSHKRDSENS